MPDEFRPGAVRRDFLDGLNLTDEGRAAEVGEALEGHLRALIPRVTAILPEMDARRRALAQHCLSKAAEALEATVKEPLPRVFNLAVRTRALLSLYRWPRPHSDLDDDERTPVGARVG